MDRLPDLTSLSHDEKDALIHALWAQVQALATQVRFLTVQVKTLQGRVAELETKLGVPPKTPDNSGLPPSQGKKPNRDDKPVRTGPRVSVSPITRLDVVPSSSKAAARRCG